MAKKPKEHDINRFSFGMFLVTIGIVYGDIGTSPMYVMKSIIEGNGGIANVNEEFIVGALSLIIWTVTLLTTVKYVIIAMKADNHGEGGIFSLYAIVKHYGKALIVPAMIGGSALLADGVLTPAVTVTTAVEGLRSITVINELLGPGQGVVIIITLAIIITLFSVQHSGTSKIGTAFGPVMLIWFSYLGITGLINLLPHLSLLRAFNPIYAIRLILSPYNKSGLMILGSIFLATTGAEALYSDMGHVGRINVYCSWPFVKICLILNYFGQGSWIVRNAQDSAIQAIHEVNPFYQMLPEAIRPFTIILAALAAVIASQALITGSYTLVSEAIHLDLLPHLEVKYPSDTRGQIYIGTVNTILMVCCSLVVLYFRSGSRIESAYGLAITVTMLMTTVLLCAYLWKEKHRPYIAIPVLIVFGAIESIFLYSSLGKFHEGGYVTVFIAFVIFLVMFVWYKGTSIEKRCDKRLDPKKYIDRLRDLHNDDSIPYVADNLVYLEHATPDGSIDRDILYSILDKDYKRAKAYWFISVHDVTDPDTLEYEVNTLGTDFIFRIRIHLGFKREPHLNIYLRQIVQDLLKSGELPVQGKRYSIYDGSEVGNFKFVMIKKVVPSNGDLSTVDSIVMRTKYTIRTHAGSREEWFGLDTSSIIEETVPLIIENVPSGGDYTLRRID